MNDRINLPSKEEINATTDADVLRKLLDEIAIATTSIETQLEFDGVGDDDWYARARGALIAHRITGKLATRRLHALEYEARSKAAAEARPTAKPARTQRATSENDPLTNEVLEQIPVVDVSALETDEDVRVQISRISLRINAVEADRASEIGISSEQRDERFLAATKAALKRLRAIRAELDGKRASMRAIKKVTDRTTTLSLRERRFIDMARKLLPADTFNAIWAAVDEAEVSEAMTEVACP